MKKISQLIISGMLLYTTQATAQTGKVIVDNDKVKVTEYTSLPGKPVCGEGMHTHTDHLTILLTDAKVKTTHADGKSEVETFNVGKQLFTVTSKNGKPQNFSSRGAFWAKGETHEVTNVSNKPLRFYIVETK